MNRHLLAAALLCAGASAGSSAMEISRFSSDIDSKVFISGAGSRGKGKGKRARSAKKPGRYSHNHYPFSSDRQDEKTARTQHMVVVNGFPLMQTIPARDRKAPVVALAA